MTGDEVGMFEGNEASDWLETNIFELKKMRVEKGKLEKEIEKLNDEIQVVLIQDQIEEFVGEELCAKITEGKNETVSKKKLIEVLETVIELDPDAIKDVLEMVVESKSYTYVSVSKRKIEEEG